MFGVERDFWFMTLNVSAVARALWVLVLLAIFSPGWATETTSPLRLGLELPLSVLEDADGSLSIEAVSNLKKDQFRRHNGGFSTGFTRSVYWLRVDMLQQALKSREGWLVLGPPFIDSVKVFEKLQGQWLLHSMGDLLPLSSREVQSRNFVVYLRPDSEGPLFIRLESTSTLMLYGQLWQSASSFASQEMTDARNWGLYFGALGGILLVISLVWLTFRRRQLGLIFLAVFFNVGMIAGLQGFHIWLLWPDLPTLASMSVGVFVCLGSGMAVLTLRECLGIDGTYPRLALLYTTVGWLQCLGAISVPLNLYDWIGSWVTLVTELMTVGAIVLSIHMALGGRKLQWAFAFTFLAHFLVVLPALTINLGWFPASSMWHQIWQFELIPYAIAVTGLMLLQMRHAHVAWISKKNDALLATQEAKSLLERLVDERTYALNNAKQGLQEALRSESQALFEQRQFMAMVSHEFRTPLAVIDSATHNLIDLPPSDHEELVVRANQILRACLRLSKLTDTCLADARLRDDAFALQFANVDLKILLREAAEIVGWSAGHRLDLNLDDAPQQWICDPALVRIAVSNLLDNAIKYGGVGVVSLSACMEHGLLRINVHDSGNGVPLHERERIFKRYERGTYSPAGKGSGLGLAVVRMIANAHGGRVELHTTSGCTFSLWLSNVSTPAQH